VIACVPEDQVPGLLAKAGKKKAADAARGSTMRRCQASDKRTKDLKTEFELGWRLQVLREIKTAVADSDCKMPPCAAPC
jgi:hypothetical protein